MQEGFKELSGKLINIFCFISHDFLKSSYYYFSKTVIF